MSRVTQPSDTLVCRIVNRQPLVGRDVIEELTVAETYPAKLILALGTYHAVSIVLSL